VAGIIPSFREIERILNDKLPVSARQDLDWWANESGGRHVQAQAWIKAGWKVKSGNFSKKKVEFVRK
jgi:hypothetical protein